MVTREFAIKAAEGYRGLDGENENTTGNAFDGSKESHDREMWNALHAVNMQGDEAVNPSSIANAQLRVTSVFAEAGANKKGKAERGLSIEQMMLLENIRDLIAGIDQRIEVIEQEIDFLNTIADDDSIMTVEAYDDLSQEDQERLDTFLGIAEISLEDYLALSVEERIQLRDDVKEAKIGERDNLYDIKLQSEDLIAEARSAGIEVLIEPLPVTNGRFDNPILEAAVQEWEDENQREFDRYNVNVSDFSEVAAIIEDQLTFEVIADVEAVAEVTGVETEVSSYIQQGTSGMTFKL